MYRNFAYQNSAEFSAEKDNEGRDNKLKYSVGRPQSFVRIGV